MWQFEDGLQRCNESSFQKGETQFRNSLFSHVFWDKTDTEVPNHITSIIDIVIYWLPAPAADVTNRIKVNNRR